MTPNPWSRARLVGAEMARLERKGVFYQSKVVLEESRFKGHGSGARLVGVEMVTILGRNTENRRGRKCLTQQWCLSNNDDLWIFGLELAFAFADDRRARVVVS